MSETFASEHQQNSAILWGVVKTYPLYVRREVALAKKYLHSLSIQSEQNPLENAMHPRNETTVTKQLEFLPRNCTGKASCAASKENRVQKTRVHIPPGLQD